ncbi:glycosyl hydrolase family 18 protein [Aminipila sp.]|uniref:glycosyl hydrolase family 18 protein n=1 Tax=Aminipila sp. TaxID=2060095 RepID=UPI00289F3352|nr:glycosyl hydrolase family 18 protein [Aminipila sp.]
MEEIIVNGYVYPSVQPEVLEAWLQSLSLISTFSYGITPDGALIPLDDEELIQAASNAEVGSLMVLTPMNEQGQFSEYLVSDVLGNPVAVDRLLNEILNEMKEKNLFGVDFDFEYVPVQNRDQYTELVTRAAEMFNPEGYLVTVALAPKISADQQGLLYQGHDYFGMGQAANFVLLMTYEWGYTYGPPMAVAPINKVRQVIEYGVSEIPPDKILMGIPNYGYDWKLPYIQRESMAEKITSEEAVRRAQQYGAEIQFDETAQSPYFTYWKSVTIPNGDGTEMESYEQHEVWFEDDRSYKAKMDIVKEFGLAGISIWNIMNYNQELVDAINNAFSVSKVY